MIPSPFHLDPCLVDAFTSGGWALLLIGGAVAFTLGIIAGLWLNAPLFDPPDWRR
jgi:hypothetical protein